MSGSPGNRRRPTALDGGAPDVPAHFGGSSVVVAQPSAGSANVDDVFTSLADPTRRRLLELLGQRPGCSASTLAGQLPVSRQAIVKHLAVLESSHLVAARRSGREVLYSVEPGRLTATASWLEARAGAWRNRLETLKRAAESEPQSTMGSTSRARFSS